MREIDIDQLEGRAPYRLLTGLVIPRPIAWVSTIDEHGRPNLAPHSFFTVASAAPPIVQFMSVTRKDSLTSIESTGEFVVNLAPRSLRDAMNATSASLPHGESEFDHAGLATAPSVRVRPPRVADAPAHLECALERVIPPRGQLPRARSGRPRRRRGGSDGRGPPDRGRAGPPRAVVGVPLRHLRRGRLGAEAAATTGR